MPSSRGRFHVPLDYLVMLRMGSLVRIMDTRDEMNRGGGRGQEPCLSWVVVMLYKRMLASSALGMIANEFMYVLGKI